MEAILFLKITINFIIFNINSLVCLYHHVYVFKVLLQLYTLKKSKSLNKKNKKTCYNMYSYRYERKNNVPVG